MIANTITLTRMGLVFGVVWLLFQPSTVAYAWAWWLTVLIIWMDGLDGFAARLFKEESTFGAVLDIIGDRLVEQVYWITFAVLGWIPLWMVLVVIARGVIVDGLRSVALQSGKTAFGQSSMMQSPIAVLLVSSRFSRWTYAVAKALFFALMILDHWPSSVLPLGLDVMMIHTFAMIALWFTLMFCVIRGLPVIVEVPRFL